MTADSILDKLLVNSCIAWTSSSLALTTLLVNALIAHLKGSYDLPEH